MSNKHNKSQKGSQPKREALVISKYSSTEQDYQKKNLYNKGSWTIKAELELPSSCSDEKMMPVMDLQH